MSTRCVVTLSLAALALSASRGYSEEKRPDVGDFPFWTAPKNLHARPFVPGLNAVLQLSDEQSRQITTAREDILGTEAVKAASQKDPNATEAQRKANQKIVAEATAKLHEKVGKILTGGQHVLIARINTAHSDICQAVLDEFQANFAAAKGNEEETAKVCREMQEKITSEFGKKLDGILSAEQKAAMKKAAATEKAREAEGKKLKEGK
jgi:hypothetical protein